MVTNVLTLAEAQTAPAAAEVRNITSGRSAFAYGGMVAALKRRDTQEHAVMEPDFTEPRPSARRTNIVSALGLLLARISIGTAWAELAILEQRRACTPDVYRLCAAGRCSSSEGAMGSVRAVAEITHAQMTCRY